MKKVVLTGATSMIGISLIEECLIHNCKVIALCRCNSQNLSRLPESENVQVVNCGLDKLQDLGEAAIGSCDVFYHIAWTDTDKTGRLNPRLQDRNVGYTLDAVELAYRLGCKKFVGIGSQAEYGIHVDSQTGPDSPVMPQIAYGVSKYAAGKLGAIRARQLGIDFFWIRVFSVYGPNDMPGTLVRSTLEKMLCHEHCAFTQGSHQWDYLYSRDAGKALYLIGERAVGSKVYCLGSGQGRPLREYIETMRDIAAPGMELRLGEMPYPAGGCMSICADISSLSRDTGWEPKTDFKDGIALTLQAIRKAQNHEQ